MFFFGFLEGQVSSLKSQLEKNAHGMIGYMRQGLHETKSMRRLHDGAQKLFLHQFFLVWEPHFLPLGIPKPYASRLFVGLALIGKDIVFRFIIEYSSSRDSPC
jgi:hypothetical protein